MPRMPALPYWRLSSFYFWYYAIIGAFSPYFARWLLGLGFSGVAIGSIMAAWYGTRIVSPPLWSHWCTGSPSPQRWLHFGAAAAALSFAGFLFARDFVPMLAVMLAFGFFANAILPQFEALTLARLGSRRDQYGRIRLWGSVGFLLVAVAYGPLLDRIGDQALPALMLPLLAAMALSALANRAAAAVPAAGADSPRLGKVLRRREVRAFLLLVLLMQAGFGPFYVFFTIHLTAHGHDGGVIGALWGLGVLAEIVLFALLPRWLPQLDAGTILRACIAASVLRWLVVALWPQSLAAMVGAQLVHALGFGAFHVACMQRVAAFFPGRLGQHGQGLLYGFSSGIGGVLGALMAGALWQYAGGSGAFIGAAIVSLLALLLALPRFAPAAERRR
jgi:MFS transporter, PPP family, 3-phenylpropionic acid transporter